MNKKNQTVSIDEFGSRNHFRTNNSEDEAILTHYLRNLGNRVSINYQKEAKDVLRNFVEYKSEISTPVVSEDIFQQLLFEVEKS